MFVSDFTGNQTQTKNYKNAAAVKLLHRYVSRYEFTVISQQYIT